MLLSHSKLDEIWDKAKIENMCGCSTDDRWEQDITGYIFCRGCKTYVVKPPNYIEVKVTIFDYEFEEKKGVSGVLFPDGRFEKCGNGEHHMLMSDIPMEVQFGCAYFSSTMQSDGDGNITHSPVRFKGLTKEQTLWIEQNERFFDRGQRRFDVMSWKRAED